MPDQITTADMSQHWRIIDATGSDDSHRIHGKWWVSIASIVAIDVCIWDKELNRGRVFYSRDLTAFVRDRRRVELPKHMIASDRLAEAEDAWDLLMAVIQAVADTPWDAGGRSVSTCPRGHELAHCPLHCRRYSAAVRGMPPPW